MTAHRFFLHVLLFLAALATADDDTKGTVFLCTAVNNARTESGVMGTQINMALWDVAPESISSICGSLDKQFKNTANGYGGNPANCHSDNKNNAFSFGINVPTDAGNTGADAARMVVSSLEAAIEGNILVQLINAPTEDGCLVINIDTSEAAANLNRTDRTTLWPGLSFRNEEFDWGGFPRDDIWILDAIVFSKANQSFTLPDNETIINSIGDFSHALGTTRQTSGVRFANILPNYNNNNISISVMFDTGGPTGGQEAWDLEPDDWKILIGQMVNTMIADGNNEPCLAMTVTGGTDNSVDVAVLTQLCLY